MKWLLLLIKHHGHKANKTHQKRQPKDGEHKKAYNLLLLTYIIRNPLHRMCKIIHTLILALVSMQGVPTGIRWPEV